MDLRKKLVKVQIDHETAQYSTFYYTEEFDPEKIEEAGVNLLKEIAETPQLWLTGGVFFEKALIYRDGDRWVAQLVAKGPEQT